MSEHHSPHPLIYRVQQLLALRQHHLSRIAAIDWQIKQLRRGVGACDSGQGRRAEMQLRLRQNVAGQPLRNVWPEGVPIVPTHTPSTQGCDGNTSRRHHTEA